MSVDDLLRIALKCTAAWNGTLDLKCVTVYTFIVTYSRLYSRFYILYS